MRTPERTQFLEDIITTAVEGGTGYWAEVVQYQYNMNGELHRYVGPQIGTETRATLRDMESGTTFALTLDNVAHALGVLRGPRENIALNSQLRAQIIRADRANDAGDLDAELADVIAQVAVLQDVVYG